VLSQTPFVPTSPRNATGQRNLSFGKWKKRTEKVGEVYLGTCSIKYSPLFRVGAIQKKKQKKRTPQHVSFVYLLMFTNFHAKMKKVFLFSIRWSCFLGKSGCGFIFLFFWSLMQPLPCETWVVAKTCFVFQLLAHLSLSCVKCWGSKQLAGWKSGWCGL